MQRECRRLGAAVLKVEPELPDSGLNRARLASYGFAPSRQSIQPRSTVLLDIRADEETILQRMKSKWRYNVRLAQRKGVRVRQASLDDLSAFNALMAVTGARDGFGVHAPAYYEAAYRLLAPDHAAFLLAEAEGQPIGAIVVGLCGQSAWYLWGASSNQERNRMPNHALQWAGMQWAKAHGAACYDFWGVPDDIGKLAAGMAGDGRRHAPRRKVCLSTWNSCRSKGCGASIALSKASAATLCAMPARGISRWTRWDRASTRWGWRSATVAKICLFAWRVWLGRT